MQEDNLVTIATFVNPLEANIARGMLESEGIECILLDEQSTQIQPYLAFVSGGVRLQVRESDAEKAEALLDEAYSRDVDEGEEDD